MRLNNILERLKENQCKTYEDVDCKYFIENQFDLLIDCIEELQEEIKNLNGSFQYDDEC